MEICVSDEYGTLSYTEYYQNCVGEYLVGIEGDERFCSDDPLTVCDIDGLYWFLDQYEFLMSKEYQPLSVMDSLAYFFHKYRLDVLQLGNIRIASLVEARGGTVIDLFEALLPAVGESFLWDLMKYDEIGAWYRRYRNGEGFSVDLPDEVVGQVCVDDICLLDRDFSPVDFLYWASEKDAPISSFVDIKAAKEHMVEVSDGVWVCLG